MGLAIIPRSIARRKTGKLLLDGVCFGSDYSDQDAFSALGAQTLLEAVLKYDQLRVKRAL